MHRFAQRWVSLILERLLPDDVGQALVGDLLEEHALRARTVGARRAALWYWGQVGRSVVPMLQTSFRRGDWVLAWVVGFIAHSFAAAAEASARASVATVATHTAVDAVPVLIIYLGAIAFVTYVAERVRAGAAVALALIVELTAVVQLVTASDGMPLWYRLVFLFAGPAAVLAGGTLFARWSRVARRRRAVA
jgi:hypothetical protein